ncbi:hypothetical protein NDU88_004255 [Pleurodeles waltl]|uniref:Uncharacterized protein n=1 Tax=Pleurodeles waltl TaxID=8319 RepID=A0AAV7PGX6_PLEWA|nr:hypothetical protein NDU88_004255 [Pleurodeles waltl]
MRGVIVSNGETFTLTTTLYRFKMTVWRLLTYGSGRHLIAHLYKAMRLDAKGEPTQTHAAWDVDYAPICNTVWDRICELTRTVAGTARFRLIDYNFLQRIYVTPKDIHHMAPTRFDTCPRCNTEGRTFYTGRGTIEQYITSGNKSWTRWYVPHICP